MKDVVHLIPIPIQGVDTVDLFALHSKPPLSNNEIHCTGRSLIANGVYPLTLALSVPIHEFILFPLLRHRTLSMLQRIGVGIIISLLGIVCFFLMDLIGHIEAKVPVECMLYANSTLQGKELIPLDPRFLILPMVLIALGEMQVFIAGEQAWTCREWHRWRLNSPMLLM